MGRGHQLVYALNAGGVDQEALSRIDLEKMRLSGEHPVSNWLPRVIGPATLRPGLESLAVISGRTRQIDFVRDSATTAMLLLSNNVLMIYNTDGSPVTVVNSASTVVNPTFESGGGGWSDVSDTGAGTDGTATMNTGVTLVATRWRGAAIEQSVSIAGDDQAKPHTIRIEVGLGPVFFRVGTSSGTENILTETKLASGTHKLTITPNAGAIYIRIRSEDAVARSVIRCQFEHTILGGSGSLFLPTPWAEADLPFLSWDQSADVIYVGNGVVQPRQIERRGPSSWSVVIYESRKGPLMAPATDKISLQPNTYANNGTMTSNLPYFKPSHVGALFELTHNEQHVIDELNAGGQFTDHITIRGIFSSEKNFNDRNFGLTIDFATGSFVGVILMESSTDPNAEVWAEAQTYSTGVATTYNDEQSNLLIHYRFRVSSYTSGYALVTLTQLAGSSTGLVRVINYNSPTSVNYESIVPFGGIGPTTVWRGPQWSNDLGWPRVPRLSDGRLWWFRGDKAFGSIVDDYTNYDDTRIGDSGPIIRSIGSGPAEGARWALDLGSLVVGTSGFEALIRSSSLEEPITPTAFTVRTVSTLGVSFVPAVKVDQGALFAQRSSRRLYELISGQGGYASSDISRLNPSAFSAGIKAMAAQRQPDTRVYIVLEDGSCVVLTYERDEKVIAFTTLETDGLFEDVAVLPDQDQDDVYFIVNRAGIRYWERLAPEAAQRSVSTCTLLDAFKVLTGPVSSIAGATHLAGRTVQVWADGQRRADVTINGSGVAALGATYSRVVYGLSYDAEFLSAKLAYAAQLGTALGQTKIVRQASLVLSNSCLDGIRIGKDVSNTDPMPAFVNGVLRTKNQFFKQYDFDLFPIPSDWSPDARIYFKTNSAEGPVTVQAMVIDVETREGVTPAARNR